MAQFGCEMIAPPSATAAPADKKKAHRGLINFLVYRLSQ